METETADLREKYRPKSFGQVLGNRVPKSFLISSILARKFPKAIINHGITGTGKTSLAYLTHMGLTCQNFNGDVCGTCKGCRLALKYYPHGFEGVQIYDCLNLDANRLTEILRENTNLCCSNRIGRQVLIFDEFHRVAERRLQDKFLRKIETCRDLFIFTLIDLSCIEGAFKDRATILKTTPPKMEEVLPWLESICNAERIIIKEKEALKGLAEESRLIPRSCLGMLQLILGLKEPITVDLINQLSENRESAGNDAPTYKVIGD